MNITAVTAERIRQMDGQEGLVLQGCGGSLEEWVDGINGELTEAGILKDGSKFENVFSFENDGLPCLLYPFDGVSLDMGKLAVWRLRTHENFGGTWLSDYVPDRMGGFFGKTKKDADAEKPDCELSGQDGNVFNLAGVAARTLRRHGQEKQADEMTGRVLSSGSYGKALSIIGEYVNIV